VTGHETSQSLLGEPLSHRVQFDCFESIAEGFVAFGAAPGPKGSTRAGHQFVYGCQGESWEELQGLIRRLASSVAHDLGLAQRPAPIEVRMKPWPTDLSLLITPYGDVTAMFKGLANIGRPIPGRVVNSGGITEVRFRKEVHCTFICPERDWKPELVSCLLHHLEATLRRRTPDGAEPPAEDWQEILAEILYYAHE